MESENKRTKLSRAAYKLFSRKNLVAEVSDYGIRRRRHEIIQPPFIRIRNFNNPEIPVRKVYTTPEESQALSKHFELSRKMLEEGTLFLHAHPGKHYESIIPSWAEMVRLAWRATCLDWVEGLGPLPNPPELRWKTLPSGYISMPALDHYHNFFAGLKSIVEGKLVLKDAGEAPQGAFYYGNGKVALYTLSLSGLQYSKFQMKADEEFDLPTFKTLFGPYEAALKYYSCRKRAGKQGVGFGYIDDIHFIIKSSKKKPLNKNDLYYFEFIRELNRLIVNCYFDEAQGNLLGTRLVALDPFGYPISIPGILH
jgi:hypothetical protein